MEAHPLEMVLLERALNNALHPARRIHNADVHMNDNYEADDLVDVIEGSRVYVPAIYVVNKIDQVRFTSGKHGWIEVSVTWKNRGQKIIAADE
jgi:ribosome-interacting GTPase 1